MDSDQKIREFLNNEDTKEIVNFLFDLPTPAFKFWGGLIKQSYKSKILEGSGVLEALKIEEEQKELRKEAAILALLLKGNLLRGIVNCTLPFFFKFVSQANNSESCPPNK